MMNRTPSRRLAWGKYALLIGTLYVSAAFVAPYQKQIVDLTPKPLQPVVSALVPEKSKIVDQNSQPETVARIITELPEEDVIRSKDNALPLDPEQKPKSKWVLVVGDTMYWSIPATANLADIALIQQDIAKYGGLMSINEIKYDPKQLFLTALTVAIKGKGTGGMGSPDETDSYTPTKGYSGYITKEIGIGMGQAPPEPLLSRLKENYEEAVALQIANKNEYLAHKLINELSKKAGNMGGRSYMKESIKSLSSKKELNQDGIGISRDNKLILDDQHKDADIYLNAEPSTIEALNGLSIDKIDKVDVQQSYNPNKKYIMVYTN